MHEIDRCRNSKLRQTKKRKTKIVELSFPKLLGFDFIRKWVKGLDERPNKSPNWKGHRVSHYKLGEVVDSNVVDSDWDFLI